MAQQAQQVAQDGSLIAIIGDEVRRRSTRAGTTNDGPAAVRTTTTRSHPCSPSTTTTFSRPRQDTVTGFLLAGVGHKDYRQNTNFLIVDTSKHTSSQERIAKKFRPNFIPPSLPKKNILCLIASHRRDDDEGDRVDLRELLPARGRCDHHHRPKRCKRDQAPY